MVIDDLLYVLMPGFFYKHGLKPRLDNIRLSYGTTIVIARYKPQFLVMHIVNNTNRVWYNTNLDYYERGGKGNLSVVTQLVNSEAMAIERWRDYRWYSNYLASFILQRVM